MQGAATKSTAGLTRRLNYRFRRPQLLETALTHRSASRQNNERLEYLGDAILDFLIAEALYLKFPDAAEGALTRMRASLVKRESLAALGRQLELGELLHLGPGEKRSGGWRRDSILANALEALIGAIYLDSAIDECRRVVLELFQPLLANLTAADPGKDPKTALQEYLQANKLPLPAYSIIGEEGEAHARVFRVACQVPGLPSPVTAEGRSRRNAEQTAARIALELLDSGTS